MSINPLTVTLPPDYQGQSQDSSFSWDAITTPISQGVVGRNSFFETKQFTQIQDKISALQENGLSSRNLLYIAARTVSIIQTYRSLYNLVASSPIGSLIPYEALTAPLASAFLSSDALVDNIEAWQKAKDTDKKNDALMQMGSNVASILYSGIRLTLFFMAVTWAIPAQVALKTLTNTIKLHDTFLKQGPSEKEAICNPPTISTKI